MNSVTSAHRPDASAVGDVDGGTPHAAPPGADERLERQAAQARHDAFAASGAPLAPFDCRTEDDADHCGTRGVENPVLFLRQGNDADAIDPADVSQRQLNDCHLMAPLAALASSPEGRELIKSAIRENRNGKGDVVSYTVTLHKPGEHFWSPAFTEVRFTVDARFGVDAGSVHKAAEARGGPSAQHEIWPLVMEKAFAQYLGGYSKLDARGSPAAAMEILTGKRAADISLQPGVYGPGRLQRDVAEGKLVVLLTKKGALVDAPNLAPNHCYQVAEVRPDGDRLWVKLHNPWNMEGREPPEIHYDELPKWFDSVDVGRVR